MRVPLPLTLLAIVLGMLLYPVAHSLAIAPIGRVVLSGSSSFSKVYASPPGRAALDSEPLELCQENAELVIEEVRRELGTIFGYDPASRAVGISGQIELVEVDGPTISVSLSGRFWHATDTVMLRVSSFVRTRIPEVFDVVLDMQKSDIKDDNRLNTEQGGKKLY